VTRISTAIPVIYCWPRSYRGSRGRRYSEKEAGGYLSVQYIFDVVGDTGLLTHVEDLSRWDRNFYENVLGKGDSELIENMLTSCQLGSGESIACAFGLELEQYRGLKVVRHSGGAAGYDTEMMRFPEQELTVLVLSNLAQQPENPRGERSASAAPAIELNMAAHELEALVGSYYSTELDAGYAIRLDGSLMLRISYDPRIELVPIGPDTWRVGRMAFRFIRDRSGKITGLNVSSGRIRDIYFRKDS